MSARIWFYYANEQQVGPVSLDELMDAIADEVVKKTDYVYKEGFSDWKVLAEVDEIPKVKSGLGAPPPPPKKNEGRNWDRAVLKERVVAHNDLKVITGVINNISIAGLFLETNEHVFEINDAIKLTLKEGKGLGKPLHLKGVVVRQARDPRKETGYGIELRGLDKNTRDRIDEYIKRHQDKKAS